MSLVNQLVSSVQMSQLTPLKVQSADQDVLENFYVCWLAMMADDGLSQAYQDFVAKTHDEAWRVLQSGDVMVGVADFLAQHNHQALAQALAQHAFADEASVINVMPLLVHHGMALLKNMGNPHEVAHEHYPQIRKRLPSWAASVLPEQALSPTKAVNVATKELDCAVDTLVVDAQNLVASVNEPQPVSVDVLMGEELTRFDEFFGANSTVDAAQTTQTDNLVFELPDGFLDNHKSVSSGINSQDTHLSGLSTEHLTVEIPSESDDVIKQSPLVNHDTQALSLEALPVTSHAQASDAYSDSAILTSELPSPVPSSTPTSPNSSTTPQEMVTKPTTDVLDNPFAYNNPTPSRASDEVDNDQACGSYGGGKSKKRAGLNPLVLGVPVILLALLGGGAWYFLKYKSEANVQHAETVGTPTLTVSAKPTSRLNITVDDKGGLYACQAELGTPELQAELMGILNSSFNATTCVLDINESISGAIVGIDRLSGVIALLKSKRFASLEMTNNQILIHAPNGDDVAWLVKEISALLSGSQIVVAAVPAHNRDLAIKDSHERGQQALTALPNGTGGFALARAMSLPVMEFDVDGNLTPASQDVLNLGANHLKANPDVRLIIAAHTSHAGDSAQDLLTAQRRADSVRNYLLSQGVSEGQLVAQGVGSRFPVADNETEFGRFKNNRVEFLEYSEAIMQALSPPTTPVTMGNQDLDQGGVYYSNDTQAAVQSADIPVYAESAQPPVQGTPQPIYDVQNGQIVQEAPYVPPQPITPAAPTVHIDDDLLKPIGADPSQGGQAIQINP